MPADDLDRLTALMLSASRRIGDQARGRGFSPYTALRIEALRFIAEADRPTMRELAARFAIAPPSATALVGGLVKSGAVARKPDPADRRITRLALTAAGKKALATGTAQVARQMRAVFANLSAAERRDLARIFEKLDRVYAAPHA